MNFPVTMTFALPALRLAGAAYARLPQPSTFTMAQVLGYPYPENLIASKQGVERAGEAP